jgi:hypothetical protein
VHETTPNGGYPYSVASYQDQKGCTLGERILVDGMVHYWSGGSKASDVRFITDPLGPSAAVASWRFLAPFTLRNTRRPCAA